MGDWREEWETRWYRVPPNGSEYDFLRVRMRTERGQLVRFVAQYEAIIEQRVYPVVRYDTAHGRPHRDTLNWRGWVVNKVWLSDEPYGKLLDDATDDIWAQWQTYRAELERRKS